VVHTHALQVCLRRNYILTIHLFTIAQRRHIAWSFFHSAQELFLKVSFAYLTYQLHSTTGILHDLSCLYTGEIIKEPSAAGIHQHLITLNFHHTQYPVFFNWNHTM